MRSTVKENIAEHSQQVAIIAHALGVINNEIFGGEVDANELCVMAIFHEASEVLTGDLPTPIKYFNQTINTAYKELEEVAVGKLISYLPRELQYSYSRFISPDPESYEYKLLKAADKLSALIKCIDEQKSGNTEFKKAKQSIEREIAKFNYPEVKYFLDNFLDAYQLTLDELSE